MVPLRLGHNCVVSGPEVGEDALPVGKFADILRYGVMPAPKIGVRGAPAESAQLIHPEGAAF